MSTDLVLVLGAGASVPFGFPTGNELRHWICDMWTYRDKSDDSDDRTSNREQNRAVRIFRTLRALSIDPSRAAEIGKLLAESKLPSIDRLVFHRSSEIAEISRVLISAFLLDSEHEESLQNSRTDGDWFLPLWSSLTAGRKSISDVPTNKLAVFTFNYDRSLEMLLLSACKATYGVDNNEATAFVSSIRIEHFYGVTTPLIELHGSGVSFDCDRGKLFEAVAKAEKEIWLVDDQRQRQVKVFDDAREAMEGAQIVTFLGYGFDEVNDANLGIANWLNEIAAHQKDRMLRLADAPRIQYIPGGEVKIDPRFTIPPTRGAPKFQSTTLGMYDREVEAAIRRMGLKRGNDKGQITVLPKDCSQALREWGTFDLLRS